MKRRQWGIVVVAALVASVLVTAQEREDRTLLTQEQMTAIINEASGERAMHTLLEFVAYQRVRPPVEYEGTFRDSEVMARFAREYGYSNVTVEKYGQGTAWQPTQGELWMTTPKSVKLYDIQDIALSLATLNSNTDVTGELVDVGLGRAQDFEGKDVTGKFVLASLSIGGAGGVLSQAVQRGAVGAIAMSMLGEPRANDYPDQIVSRQATANPATASGWNVTPKVARELAGMLRSGQAITIRSVVKSVQVPSHSEYVHAEIPGDGSTTQEAAISAHLYEGVIKQGANDDASGCALTLEIGRTYLKLIKEGKLPRPKRTINFQWVVEMSGTNQYLNAHPEKEKAIIGTLNFDMEALRIADSRSYWVMQRTPDTFPSYLNDIGQSMMEYVADVSRERVRFRSSGYAPSQPIESARGSKDAFYIKIDKHYGSSDHVTYMQHGIPAVMFITWPDMCYHSSEDTPDKQDPTQYKRAAVVGAGALAVLASGTDEMAARVLKENLGRGLSRMGESHTKGLGYLADAASGADALAQAYKEARVAILHQAEVEKGVVQSASVLWTNAEDGKKKTAVFQPLIDQRAAALLNEVKAAFQLQTAQRGVPATEPAMTPEEREASNLIVQQVSGAGRGGGGAGAAGGGRGGGAGAAGAAVGGRAGAAGAAGGRAAGAAGAAGAPAAAAAGRGGGGGGRGGAAAGPSLPQEMGSEFSLLLPKNKTVLEIRDFLSGEFTPLPLADLMAVLRAREASGSIQAGTENGEVASEVGSRKSGVRGKFGTSDFRLLTSVFPKESPVSVRRGVVVVFVLIFIAMAVSLAGLAVLSIVVGAPPAVPSNATLYLPIKAPFAEVESSDVLSQFITRAPTLRQTIEAIHKAKADNRVKALVITPSAGGALWAQLQEVRSALEDFRASGKTVTAYLEAGGAQEYYLASAADRDRPHAGGPARPHRTRDLRALLPRHARQAGRAARPAAHRRLQDRREHVHGADVHQGPPRDVAVAQSRLVRRDGPRHCRRTQAQRRGHPQDHRQRAVPRRIGEAGRTRGPARLRGPARR